MSEANKKTQIQELKEKIDGLMEQLDRDASELFDDVSSWRDKLITIPPEVDDNELQDKLWTNYTALCEQASNFKQTNGSSFSVNPNFQLLY